MSGGRVEASFTPPDVAWGLFAPDVLQFVPKKKQKAIVIGTGKLSRQDKARADSDRSQWHMRRRFHETYGAILAEEWGGGGFELIGEKAIDGIERRRLFELLSKNWQYAPLRYDGVGWAELV